MAQRKSQQVNSEQLKKELEKIVRFFDELNNDKSLPTFGEHFMYCLSLGIAEKVNLKKMYPVLYKRLSKWLQEHNRRIKGSR
jgi:hypothetical protein